MRVRRTIENVIAAAVTVGGIFGLIVDAPDVWKTVSGWLTAMLSRDAGYWLLIVSGLLSLGWINFGDRLRHWFRSRTGVEEANQLVTPAGGGNPEDVDVAALHAAYKETSAQLAAEMECLQAIVTHNNNELG